MTLVQCFRVIELQRVEIYKVRLSELHLGENCKVWHVKILGLVLLDKM